MAKGKDKKEKKQKTAGGKEYKQNSKDKKGMSRLLNFPFRILFQVSLIAGLIYFFINYYRQSDDLANLLFNSILIFLTLYIAAGILLLIFFYIVSEAKIRERQAADKIETEKLTLEIEKRRTSQGKSGNMSRQSDSGHDRIGELGSIEFEHIDGLNKQNI